MLDPFFILTCDKIASLEARAHEHAVQLMKNCLSFDFIGTNPDDSAEDVGSISVRLEGYHWLFVILIMSHFVVPSQLASIYYQSCDLSHYL